jgi:adenylate kinase
MRLLLVGPPGSGKGTQAKLLCERKDLAYIGTGDILREAVKLKTAAGKRAEPFVVSGRLVPDDLVNEMVADRFRRDDRPDHFLVDGYPRTLAQAASFDQVLRQQFLSLDSVVVLLVDDEEIVRRLSGRWTCPQCRATFHVTGKPPRAPGVCDECGTALVQREDDKEETIRRRLQVYRQSTAEIIPHYRAQGLVREVPGAGDIEAIQASIINVIEKAKPTC